MQIKRLQIDDYLCLVDFDIVFDTVSGGSSTIHHPGRERRWKIDDD